MPTWRSTSAIPEPHNVTTDVAMASFLQPSPCFGSMAAGGADLRSRKAVYFACGKRALQTETEALAASRFRTTSLDFCYGEQAGAVAKLTDNVNEVFILVNGIQVRILGCSLTFAWAASACNLVRNKDILAQALDHIIRHCISSVCRSTGPSAA